MSEVDYFSENGLKISTVTYDSFAHEYPGHPVSKLEITPDTLVGKIKIDPPTSWREKPTERLLSLVNTLQKFFDSADQNTHIPLPDYLVGITKKEVALLAKNRFGFNMEEYGRDMSGYTYGVAAATADVRKRLEAKDSMGRTMAQKLASKISPAKPA